MSLSLSELFGRFFGRKDQPTAFERRLAKIFVKRRLLAQNPAYFGDPKALEEAYKALDIQMTEEQTDTGQTAFELKVPSDFPINDR